MEEKYFISDSPGSYTSSQRLIATNHFELKLEHQNRFPLSEREEKEVKRFQ